MSVPPTLLAMDIGNTSLAVAQFPIGTGSSRSWQTPQQLWKWRPQQPPPWDELPPSPAVWAVASVNRGVCATLADQVARRRPQDRWTVLSSQQFPIETDVIDKAQVGADRLAAAVAANALREPDRAAVVIDAGSAITVDLIDDSGVFRGGAILPGMAMAAGALSSDADLLPMVTPADAPPDPVGRDTAAAIRSGLYWGAWGAISELATQYAVRCQRPPHLLITGGGVLWSGLRDDLQWRPHLVLSGIAMAWAAQFDDQ